MTGRMVSPDEMMAAAKEQMLGGNEPQSHRDWQLIMNFLAANIHGGAAHQACRLMAKLYDMPLSDQEVREIVDFQLARR